MGMLSYYLFTAPPSHNSWFLLFSNVQNTQAQDFFPSCWTWQIIAAGTEITARKHMNMIKLDSLKGNFQKVLESGICKEWKRTDGQDLEWLLGSIEPVISPFWMSNSLFACQYYHATLFTKSKWPYKKLWNSLGNSRIYSYLAYKPWRFRTWKITDCL